jgi:hypothetical protein
VRHVAHWWYGSAILECKSDLLSLALQCLDWTGLLRRVRGGRVGLHHVDQLVREEFLASRTQWVVESTKVDVVCECERACVPTGCRAGGSVVCVNSNLTEVMVKPIFHQIAGCPIERLASRQQGVVVDMRCLGYGGAGHVNTRRI